jgi:hypothetical protein
VAAVSLTAAAALRHRLVLNFAAETEAVDAATLVARVLQAARRLRP